jgi:hypothetical protein
MRVADQPSTRAVCAQSYTKIRKNSVISGQGQLRRPPSSHRRSSGGIRAGSAHPRTTDMQRLLQHVGFVPRGDMARWVWYEEGN